MLEPAAHDGSADLGVEDLLLRHEAHFAAAAVQERGEPGVGEVEVPGVVDRDDRAAGQGHVLGAGDGELESLLLPTSSGRIAITVS